MNSNLTAKATLWANRCIMGALALLAVFLPKLLRWYCTIRVLSAAERGAITIAFYICAVIAAFALWQIEKLLMNILAEKVFIRENVDRIRAIRWCCLAVSVVCLPAACCYLPLIFMVVIMGFLTLMVSVVASVMDAAVAIREENDLTV